MLPTDGKRPLSRQERVDWLRLYRAENVGPVTFRRLVDRFGTATAALAAVPELARRGGRSSIRIPPLEDVERELDQLRRAGGRLLALCDPEYPERLAAIEDAPPVLAVLGDAHLLSRPAVAMVGSRNASLNGRSFARRLAEQLGKAGFVVVSGLARGIDTAVHEGGLATGTVAVMAGGLDVIYPDENTPLYRRIVEQGAAISEMAIATRPQARHFPRRNRLISGLSLGTVVVEASPHSGSLITARFALEQGREVFAVPGSPLDPRARGCNDLLRQGAIVTETVDDIVRGLGRPANAGGTNGIAGAGREFSAVSAVAQEPAIAAAAAADTNAASLRLREMLSPTPVGIDELVRNCHLPAAVVHTILLEWELAGRLERQPGNRVALVSPSSGEEQE
jgi:DNA processing protein